MSRRTIRIPTLTERQMRNFLAKRIETDPASCWLWTGTKLPRGYGKYQIAGRTYLAHRIAWSLAYGGDPGWLTVEHRCMTPACVNPSHLELLTLLDNVMAITSHGAGATKARQTHCLRGHDLANAYVRTDRKGRTSRMCRPCATARSKAHRLRTPPSPRKSI